MHNPQQIPRQPRRRLALHLDSEERRSVDGDLAVGEDYEFEIGEGGWEEGGVVGVEGADCGAGGGEEGAGKFAGWSEGEAEGDGPG